MNTQRLYLPDGSPAKVWACQCGTVFTGEASAEKCCTCFSCGKETGKKLGGTCPECWRRDMEKYEARRLAEAVTVAQLEEGQWVSWDDEYADSVYELRELLECMDLHVPEFFWVCDPEPILQIDADRVIEDCTQNAYEGWDGDLAGITEFRAACEAFEKANASQVFYFPDYKFKISTNL